MANRNEMPCFVCDRIFRLNQLTRLDGDDNAVKREIAMKRCEEAGMQVDLMYNARLCLNCNCSINNEIREQENDSTCATFQTY